jgi:tetratricopeptide (TPR) repeat protein
MSGTGSRTISLDPASGGFSVPRLYFALLRQRFTGTVGLSQRDPAGVRTVWFRGGMPVFTDWVSDDELGPSDAATRSEALRDQCMRKLVRGFAAGAVAAEATVTAGEHDKGNGDELSQINVLALLLQGVLAHYDEARVAAEMSAELAGDLVATPALARYERQFGFEPGDAAILAALARGVSMAGLAVPGVDQSRARKIVYTLWAAQMLRCGDDAVQAIAKGATAAAAAAELGVTIGNQSAKAPSKVARQAVPTAAPKPEPKPEPKPVAKPELPAAEPERDDGFEAGLASLEAKVASEANAFVLFDLPLDADRKQIRAVWAELSKTYHPDALEGAGRAALRDRVERVFAALSEAYGILSDQQQREQLREALSAAGGSLKAGEDTAAVVRNAFEAELLARDADKLLNASQWARAAELFARAHGLSPKDSDIEAALIYVEFRRDGGDALPAIGRLAKLLADTPNCARAHYFKGLLELGIGETGSAKQSFAAAHKLNPRNIDAERQLRAIVLRERDASPSKPDPKRSFGLRGLFKKD